MGRKISDDFINDLKGGCLNLLLNKIKGNNKYILCFRENDINIYYKGGSLLDIKEYSKNNYICTFNLNYAKNLSTDRFIKNLQDLNTKTNGIIKTKKNIKGSYNNSYIFEIKGSKTISEKIINILKIYIDSYIDKENIEAIAQQRLFADNFDATIENGYIFLDREYTVKKEDCPGISGNKSAKIDGIALKIENSKVKNITLVEVKSKFNACNGKTASIAAHKNDYEAIIADSSFTKKIVEDAKFALEKYQELDLLAKTTYNIPDYIPFKKLFVFTDEIVNENELRTKLKGNDLIAFNNLVMAGETKFIKYTL